MPRLQTSADAPVPVRTVANLIGQWVARLGKVWVEGQLTQVNRRPGAATAYLTLRDPVADVSLQVTCARRVLDEVAPPLVEGARVVVFARPDFYVGRGTLSLAAEEIRPIGLGQLLARIEELRAVLAAEGLFAADRKRPLPFLPRTVGVVCGRASAAERDVCENARRRWPAVRFRVEEVAVQGVNAVTEVCAAVERLDRDDAVDVIVVTRGGGSVEDLLPFSNEALLRVVGGCGTPVVSAIGHEQDAPLLDLVADLRASTPTDAGRRIVPDVAEETARVQQLRERGRRVLTARLDAEQHTLDALRSRPALAEPAREVERRRQEVSALRDRARRVLDHRLHRGYDDLAHTRARVVALSPAATLRRGYAVVQRPDGAVVRRPDEVAVHDPLGVRLAAGRLAVTVTGTHADPTTPASRVAGVEEETLSYEQARDELVGVVRRLEDGGVSLEESLALWERGEELARICQDWLDGARQRLAAATGRATEPGSPAAEGPSSPADGGPSRGER